MALVRLNNQSISSVTALPSAAKTATTDVVLLNTITLGNQATADFTGIGSTYDVYMWQFSVLILFLTVICCLDILLTEAQF